MSNDQELPRSFRGIWIPREIWLHQELSFFEKCLWAEIDSLDDDENGCTASNEYLCKMFNCRERNLQNALTHLKKLGFIIYEKYDGRTRTLRSCVKTTYEKFNTSDPQPGAGQTRNQLRVRGAEKCTSGVQKNAPQGTPRHIYKEKIEERIEKETYKEKPPAPKGENVSNFSIGSFVRLKKEEYETLCSVNGKEIVDRKIAEINDYLASTGKKPYKDYAATIRNWLRRDDRRSSNTRVAPDPISRHRGLSNDKSPSNPSRVFDFSQEE